jgi:predicted methyltransferase
LIKKRLFIVITGRNFANKTQKSAFFIKKNDYICMETIMTNQGDSGLSTPHITLWQGDCLEEMKRIPDKSVDMVLADLP